jgi:phosphoenolpyruvate synthase/pyruvate phosphate dikinase
MIVWFDQKASAEAIGGKGLGLCRLTQAGIPVPAGFCVTTHGMETPDPIQLEQALSRLNTKRFVVRSSAVEEDTAGSSFAGIHLSRLNLTTTQDVMRALFEIRESALSPGALAYRRKLGVGGPAKMAAVIQELLNPDASGVLFMQDPVNGSDHVIIEGSWGLGESVVAGSVTPDRWVLSSRGHLLRSQISDKQIATVPDENGVKQIDVEDWRRRIPCLDSASLRDLFELGRASTTLFGTPQDVEWAIASGHAWVLQSRPITGINRSM